MTKRVCAFEECERESKARGLCMGHYVQQRRGKDLAPLQEKKRRPSETYCTNCKTTKAREDFYLRVDGGLQNNCKVCAKAASQARRDKARQAMERVAELEARLALLETP